MMSAVFFMKGYSFIRYAIDILIKAGFSIALCQSVTTLCNFVTQLFHKEPRRKHKVTQRKIAFTTENKPIKNEYRLCY